MTEELTFEEAIEETEFVARRLSRSYNEWKKGNISTDRLEDTAEDTIETYQELQNSLNNYEEDLDQHVAGSMARREHEEFGGSVAADEEDVKKAGVEGFRNSIDQRGPRLTLQDKLNDFAYLVRNINHDTGRDITYLTEEDRSEYFEKMDEREV